MNKKVPFIGNRFRLSLEDKTAPISSDMEQDSRVLFLAFGGMVGRLDIPPFEFFSLTGDMATKRLFVRDLQQSCYHQGIPGYGATVGEVAEALGELIDSHDVERLVVTGVSAGGYAALLFGTLLGADTVLAFGAQSTVDPKTLAEMDDHRWDELLERLTAEGALDPDWMDLRTVIPRARHADTRYDLYFDESYPPDRLHAERLADLDGVRLCPVAAGGEHRVASAMRGSGELERVLRTALGCADPVRS